MIKQYDIFFKILRIIGYIIIVLYIILFVFNLINVIQIQHLWVLLIIGYILIIIELVPLGINYIKLSNKSLISKFIWLSVILFVGITITVGYIMWANPMHWENYNPDFGGLIGGLIAGVATLIVVLFSLNIDQRRAVQKARTSAGILNEILSSINTQILRIQNGSKETILYPPNWLEFYYDITIISEYEYLKTLLKEFNFIERINEKIKIDFESAIELIKIRNNYYRYSIDHWNPFDISLNLIHIKYGTKESLPWTQYKNNQKIIEDIKQQMFGPIENYIYNYLVENGNTDLSDIEADIVEWIIDTMKLKEAFTERIAVKALLEICCDFKKDSTLIDFCWNELSIKRPSEMSD